MPGHKLPLHIKDSWSHCAVTRHLVRSANPWRHGHTMRRRHNMRQHRRDAGCTSTPVGHVIRRRATRRTEAQHAAASPDRRMHPHISRSSGTAACNTPHLGEKNQTGTIQK